MVRRVVDQNGRSRADILAAYEMGTGESRNEPQSSQQMKEAIRLSTRFRFDNVSFLPLLGEFVTAAHQRFWGMPSKG